MSEKETSDEATWRERWQHIASLGGRPWLATVLVLLLFVVGATVLWYRLGPGARGGEQYLMTLESIQLSNPPSWVTADVRGEVFTDAGWEKDAPSLLEPELAVNVAQAFELHTWVRKVSRVTKQSPDKVVVEVEYRQPVAMVEVDYQGQNGLLPVDSEGVLLPPEAFTAEAAAEFPRIRVDFSGPRGPIGTPWGDKRVWAACKIATGLLEQWHELNLYRIVYQPSKPPTSKDQAAEYELFTKRGDKIVWGHSPGEELPGEATAQQKINRLAHWLENLQLSAGGAAVQTVDLRDAQRISSHGNTTLD